MPDAVTVVIPTHDRDRLLSGALDSVLAQDLPAASVVVSDDRGSAETRRLVETVAAGAAVPVRYVDSSGPGAGTAGASRNAGARDTQTGWLAFLDDDDVWDPRFLSQALARVQGNDFVVAWTRADRPGYEMARMPVGCVASDVVARNPGFVGSNFVMSASAFWSIDGFDPTLTVSNDKDLLVRALAAGLTYAVVEEFLVTNRIHDGGQLTDKTPRREAGIRRYMDKHASLLSRRDLWFLRSQLASVRRVTAPTVAGRLLSGAQVAATRTLYRLTAGR